MWSWYAAPLSDSIIKDYNYKQMAFDLCASSRFEGSSLQFGNYVKHWYNDC